MKKSLNSNTTSKPGAVSCARLLHRALRRLCLFLASGVLALTSAQAATIAWTGAGGDINWSTAANWSNGVPTATAAVFFVTNGTADFPSVPTSVVDADQTILSLSLQNTNPASYHTIVVNPGVTLTLSNAVNNAYVVTAGGAYQPAPLRLNGEIQGTGGSIRLIASNAIFSVRQSQSTTSGSGSRYTLDMSQLDALMGYIGRLYVAGDSGNRANGTLYLPKTNILTLSYSSGPAILLGYCGTGADGGILQLGMTNAFFSNVGMWVGYRRTSASALSFNASTANGGKAYFRNYAGTGRQNYWRIADASTQTYSGNACNGEVDFSLGTVDAMIDELVVARNMTSAGAPSGYAAGAVGTLTFNAGTIDVNNVIVGYQTVKDGPPASGTINVDGTAQLMVNNSMQLGRFTANSNVLNTGFAKLNIGTIGGGGSVVVKGSITTAVDSQSVNQSEVNIRNGGSLSVRNTMGPLYFLELSGGALTLELDGNPTSPVCYATNLQTAAGFNLTVQGAALEIGQFPLFKYETYYGAGADDFVLTLAPYLEGYLSNNTANSSIDLVITNKVITVWNGNINDNWDIATTANWKDGTSGAAKTYGQASIPGDIVWFNDSAANSGNVNLTTDLAPFQVLVDNDSKAYTFSGSGRLTGPTGLTKNGPGVLTIANAGLNDFAGEVAVNGGILRLGGSANRLPTSATMTLADTAGAAFDLNNLDQTLTAINGGGASGGEISLGSGVLTISGSGSFGGVISGSGKLVKSGSGTLSLPGANTFSGGTLIQTNSTIQVENSSGSGLGSGSIVIDDSGKLLIGNGASSGSVATTTITNNGSLEFNVTNDLTLANYIVGTGSVSKRGVNRLTMNTANDFSGIFWLIGGGIVRVSHSGAFGTTATPDSYFSMAIPNTSGASLELANNITLDEEIRYSCKTGTLLLQPTINSVDGTNTLNGTITLTGGGSVHNFSAAAGSKLIVNGPLVRDESWQTGFPYYNLGGDGDGEMNAGMINGNTYDKMTNHLFKTGLSTWVMSGSNSYSGFTVISNGTLVVNGSILGTNTVPVNAVGFYLGCQVRAAGTLKGDGLIQCVVTNEGTIAPGSSVGSLTISNTLVNLAGSTNVFEIASAGYDQIDGLTSVIYGGVLRVELSGAVAGGQVFKLFSADTYSANTFDSFELPTLPEGLSWDTSQLTVDGTLRVSGTGSEIQIGQAGLLGDGNFQMSGTSAATNAAYRIQATTNLANPSTWVDLDTNTFVNGVFLFQDLNATNYPQRFYRIIMP